MNEEEKHKSDETNNIQIEQLNQHNEENQQTEESKEITNEEEFIQKSIASENNSLLKEGMVGDEEQISNNSSQLEKPNDIRSSERLRTRQPRKSLAEEELYSNEEKVIQEGLSSEGDSDAPKKRKSNGRKSSDSNETETKTPKGRRTKKGKKEEGLENNNEGEVTNNGEGLDSGNKPKKPKKPKEFLKVRFVVDTDVKQFVGEHMSCCHLCLSSISHRPRPYQKCFTCNTIVCKNCLGRYNPHEWNESNQKPYYCPVCLGVCCCKRCVTRGPPKWFAKSNPVWSDPSQLEQAQKEYSEKVRDAQLKYKIDVIPLRFLRVA